MASPNWCGVDTGGHGAVVDAALELGRIPRVCFEKNTEIHSVLTFAVDNPGAVAGVSRSVTDQRDDVGSYITVGRVARQRDLARQGDGRSG
jgi:hypothetical protein